MAKVGIYLIFCLVSCVFTNFATGQCTINIPRDKFIKPTFEKTFGTKFVKISSSIENISLLNLEKINGHCPTSFTQMSYFKDEDPSQMGLYDDYSPYRGYRTQSVAIALEKLSDISLQCVYDKLYIWDGERYGKLDTQVTNFDCDDYEWTIHEALQPHPWCSSAADSYFLDSMQRAFGALCFNLQNISVESVRYLAANENFKLYQKNLILQSPSELQNLKLGVEVKNVDSILNENYFQYTTKDQELFDVAVYRDENLVQSPSDRDVFSKYNKFLNIRWWHNLLHGNWKRFMNAFEEQIQNVTYDVFSGISGTVQAPVSSTCHGTDLQELKYDQFLENNGTVPRYVWLYLRAVDVDEEFVFIGYNSPYYEFFKSNEIIFCNDICNEIPWLKDARSTFRYSTLGVTFCCRADDVRNSMMLNGFPGKYEINIPVDETTTVTPIESLEYSTQEPIREDTDELSEEHLYTHNYLRNNGFEIIEDLDNDY